MTAEERLASSREKVARGRKHLQDLRTEIIGFLQTKPYEVRARRDTSTRRPIYYLASVQDTPTVISAIAGDVLHNLRCALDHLAYQLYVFGTGRTSGARHVYFPISDDAGRYKAESRRKTEGMRPNAIAALEALEPYKDGKGSGLWRLHRLNNVDKHRFLIALASAYQSVDISTTLQSFSPGVVFPPMFLKPQDRLFPLKAGAELFIDSPDAEVRPIRFTFEIALGEPTVADGMPVLELLQETADLVESTLMSLRPHLE